MKPKIFLIILISIQFVACTWHYKPDNSFTIANCLSNGNFEEETTLAKNHSKINKEWEAFTKAVLSRDFKTIRSLSTECIHCTSCVTNSVKEDSLFNLFQIANPHSWYEKLYSELCYISIDKFLTEDFELVFDSVLKSRMNDQTKLTFIVREIDKPLYNNPCILNSMSLKTPKLMEVLITTDDSTLLREGAQKAFSFINTEKGFKYCGYSTIP